MKEKIRFLDKKEKKRLIQKISEQYKIPMETVEKILKNFEIYLSGKENKVYLVSKELSKTIKMINIPIERIGSYIGKIEKNDKIRLNIEGSQLFGIYSEKIIDLSKKEVEVWMQGKEVEIEDVGKTGFYILKDDKYVYGTGYIKEGKIRNYVPKHRRIPLDSSSKESS